MSTFGQAAGGVIGAVGGFFIGGPSGALYGAQIGMTVGGYLDPVKTTINVPGLNDTTVQTSTYGADIARGYGTIPVVGNVFWLENGHYKTVIKKTKSGGKGGPTTTTKTPTYYATFAVGLLDCRGGNPIAGARRIWAGSKLIYDAGSDDLSTIIASNSASELFTLYLGTATQMPDDRMQATLGVGNVPGYRGLAYIVLKDFPLADYGNSLLAAQIKVEVVCAGSSGGPTIVSNVLRSGSSTRLYDSSAMCMKDMEIYLFKWDNDLYGGGLVRCYARNIVTGTERVISSFAEPTGGMALDGWSDIPMIAAADSSSVKFWDETGAMFKSVTLAGIGVANQTANLHKRGDEYYLLDVQNDPSKLWDMSQGTAVLVSQTTQASTHGAWHDIFLGENFNYAIGLKTSGFVDFVCMDKEWTEVWSVAMPGSATMGFTNTVGGDDAVIRERSDGICIVECGAQWYQVEETGYIYLGATAPGTDSYEEHGGSHMAYPLFIKWGVNNRVVTTKLTSFAGTTVTLASIVQAECLRSNLLALGDIDTSELTQLVRGYKISNVGSIRGAIEPLQGAWPFDVIQHGYTIKFRMRGSSSVATIPAADLDARGAGDASGVSITNSREMDSQLPRRLVLNYLDVAREYDVGTQADERLNTDAINITKLDLAIVLNASEALGIVQTLLYLYWMERYDLSFRLPPTYNHLESGDTITINADEATYSLRLTQITYTQDGRLECAAKYHSAAIYVRNAVADEGQSTGRTLSVDGSSVIVPMDIPLLLDDLDTAGYVVAMDGIMPTWPGGELFRSDDSGQTWTDLQSYLPPGSVIGFAVNTIGAYRTDLMDTASRLTASFISADLSSITQDALLNGGNAFAYGAHGRWEIIQARTCTLQSDGTYILSNILRGRQGTEWACGTHAIGDYIVELDVASVEFISVNTNSIGLARSFRGVTFGQTFDSASDLNFTYSGVNLECLSPCYAKGDHDPSYNWNVSWIRRTRVGGAWRDFVNASLGEAAESYEVDIFSSGYSTVKRTIASSSPSIVYTLAQQTADFGDTQPNLFGKIYQISAVVGRGYPLTFSLSDYMTGDPYAASRVLGMHMDTAGLTDINGHAITLTNAVRSAAQAKAGGYSAYFNGTTARLTTPHSADWQFTSVDFCVECWIYHVTRPASGWQQLVGTMGTAGGSAGWRLMIGTTGQLYFNYYSGGSVGPSASAIFVPLATWGHVAAFRYNGTFYVTWNGQIVASAAAASIANSTSDLMIGSTDGTNWFFNGYIDDLRITKGAARYVADFSSTLPQAPFLE